MAHARAAEPSDALGQRGVGGAIQAACRHSKGDNPTVCQSLKKVLHAYDLWPWVLNPGLWETCDFKTGPDTFLLTRAERGLRREAHTISNSFSQMSFSDRARLASELH